jgi:hypothetical protein
LSGKKEMRAWMFIDQAANFPRIIFKYNGIKTGIERRGKPPFFPCNVRSVE